jgi:hypothetical protein
VAPVFFVTAYVQYQKKKKEKKKKRKKKKKKRLDRIVSWSYKPTSQHANGVDKAKLSHTIVVRIRKG